MITTLSTISTIAAGIYCAKGGFARLAKRDQYVTERLTQAGAKLYRAAVKRYQAGSLTEEALYAAVRAAVEA